MVEHLQPLEVTAVRVDRLLYGLRRQRFQLAGHGTVDAQFACALGNGGQRVREVAEFILVVGVEGSLGELGEICRVLEWV